MIHWQEKQLGERGEKSVFELSGRLDRTACEDFFAILEERVEQGSKNLILDFNNLQFISSVGLGSLMRVHSRVRKQGGDVKLARVGGPVADVLKLVRLDSVFHNYPTVRAAVDSCES